MNQLNLFDQPPAQQTGRTLPQLTTSYLDHIVGQQRRQEESEINSYLPQWLQAHGWEIYKEVPTGYRAWHSKMLITTDCTTTPAQAAAIAEQAALFDRRGLFYNTGPWPPGYKLNADRPLFPNTYRTVNGIRMRAIFEYTNVWQPRHQTNAKYLSR